MTELQPQADGPAVLTPRKDRIEQALARLLTRDATRSELREVVYQYADFHRIQGLAPDVAVSALRLIARRSLSTRRPASLHGDIDSAEVTVAMMTRWYERRYYRRELSIPLAD